MNSWQRNIETFAKAPEILRRITEPAYREALALGTEVREEYHFLARGEYNENYVFIHPDSGKKYVLRINHGSQMQLERQISYEAHALKLLEASGRTPKIYYCSEKSGEPGILVMEFLEGIALDYAKDLKLGAEILTDIHGLPYNREEDRGEDRLYFAKDPLVEMLSESVRLQRVYELSPFMEDSVYSRLHALWKKGVEEKERGEKLLRQEEFCIINTELNSGNFLINREGKKNYLVDWEKPLYGHFAQDLGHFLSPTTTFWKTDYILSEKEIKGFLEHYQRCRDIELPALQEQTALFILYNCIRGLSWCAMAYTEYKKGRDLQNEDTFQKIKAYLQDPFLTQVEECCKKLF